MTIYQRIIILVLVLVLGTGLTAAIFFNRVLHAELDHDVAGRAVTIAAAMTESATSAVVTGDVLSGQDLVKRSIRRLPGVEYIYFTGFDGNVFAHSFKDGLPKALLPVNEEHAAKTRESIQKFSTSNGSLYHVSSPLIEGVKGRLHIGLSVDYALDQISEVRRTILTITFVIAALSIVIGLVVGWRISRPLYSLSQTMIQFGKEGELNSGALTRGSGGREIETLKEAFATMVSERMRAENEVRHLNQALEQRVVERTRELTREIAEREKAEEEIRESEEQFRGIVEGSIQGILVIKKDVSPLFVNDAFAAIHGYTKEEILSLDSLMHILAPSERERMTGYMEARQRGDQAPTDYQYQGVKKDGTVIWLHNRISTVSWRGEVASLAVAVDITERKEAEGKLVESESTARAFLNATSDQGVLIKTDSTILDINEAMAKSWGKQREQLIGTKTYDLFPTKETAERKERIKQVVMCGRPLVCKENLSICGLVDSGHVSGLFARYLMTAGLDGFRYLGPIQVYALARRLGVA